MNRWHDIVVAVEVERGCSGAILTVAAGQAVARLAGLYPPRLDQRRLLAERRQFRGDAIYAGAIRQTWGILRRDGDEVAGERYHRVFIARNNLGERLAHCADVPDVACVPHASDPPV